MELWDLLWLVIIPKKIVNFVRNLLLIREQSQSACEIPHWKLMEKSSGLLMLTREQSQNACEIPHWRLMEKSSGLHTYSYQLLLTRRNLLSYVVKTKG